MVIDTTNPLDEKPPVNGMLRISPRPTTRSWSSYAASLSGGAAGQGVQLGGQPVAINPTFPGGRATMFICGNDDAAKQQVAHICDQFGWDAEDMGKVEVARHRAAVSAVVRPWL